MLYYTNFKNLKKTYFLATKTNKDIIKLSLCFCGRSFVKLFLKMSFYFNSLFVNLSQVNYDNITKDKVR